MDPVANPYAPGAGTPPPLLAGRDRVIEAWDIVIGRAAAGNSFQPIVLSGLRGVGKTVLLLEFRAHARDAGWPIELFEARPGGDLRAQVAEALPPMIRTVNTTWRNKERAKKIGRIAASFARAVQARLVHGGFRFELEPEPGVADSGDLETDLTELLVALGEGARSEGVGAALLIDELHEVPPLQLSALVGAAHRRQPGVAARRDRRRRAAAGRAGAVRGPLLRRAAVQHPARRRAVARATPARRSRSRRPTSA